MDPRRAPGRRAGRGWVSGTAPRKASAAEAQRLPTQLGEDRLAQQVERAAAPPAAAAQPRPALDDHQYARRLD